MQVPGVGEPQSPPVWQVSQGGPIDVVARELLFVHLRHTEGIVRAEDHAAALRERASLGQVGEAPERPVSVSPRGTSGQGERALGVRLSWDF